jgi:hypothetical protein
VNAQESHPASSVRSDSNETIECGLADSLSTERRRSDGTKATIISRTILWLHSAIQHRTEPEISSVSMDVYIFGEDKQANKRARSDLSLEQNYWFFIVPSAAGCQSSELGQYFLFVLICPACPQFAHFRVVPVGFSMDWAGTADREPTLFGSIIDVRGAFAFSRAWRRSLFLSRRASSSLILLYV